MSRRTLLLVAILSVAALGGLLAAKRVSFVTAKPGIPPVALDIEPRYLDFGEVWETDRFEWSIPIRNREPHPVELTGLTGSCGCSVTESTALGIPPGETRTLKLTLDLRPQSCIRAGGDTRAFASAIRVTVLGGAKPRQATWQLHGIVKRPLRVPAAVTFGRRSELTLPLAPLVIPVEPLTAIRSVALECSSPHFAAAVRPVSESPLRLELVVTPAADLKRGAVSGTITLAAITPDGQALPSLELPVSAEIVPDIEPTPTAIHFGARDVGAEVTETIGLWSLSNRPFAIERCEAEGNGVSAQPEPDGRSVTVRMNVVGAGSTIGRVRLVVRPEGGEPVEVIVPVQVCGFLSG